MSDQQTDEVVDENEKRFLILGEPPPTAGLPSREIDQGYLSIRPDGSHRIRITDGEKAVLTYKTGLGVKRSENNHPTDLQTGIHLMRWAPFKLQKTRFLREGWELDCYKGVLSELMLAEFEMPEPMEVIPPDWLGEVVDVSETVNNALLAILARDLEGTTLTRPLRHLLTTRIPRVVLTGGPNSGKTTLSKLVREKIPGAKTIPETATFLFGDVGVRPPPHGHEQRIFQRGLMDMQMILENVASIHAANNNLRFIMPDRGTVDNAAYLPGGKEELVKISGMSMLAHYRPYTLVVCLAMPGEETYNRHKAGNPARTETYAEAKQVHMRTVDAWSGHHNVKMVPQGLSWPEIENYVLNIISEHVA